MLVERLEERLYDYYLPGYSLAHSESERQRLWEQACPETIYQLNAELQLLRGEGADKLSFTRPQRKMPTALRQWSNLLTLDIAHWHQQQPWSVSPHLIHSEPSSAHSRPFSPTSRMMSAVPPHYINLYDGEPIRLFYHSYFVYGQLYSALHYILQHAKQALEAWVATRYPYDLLKDLHPEQFDSLHDHDALKTYFHHQYAEWFAEQYLNAMFTLNEHLNLQTAATYIIEYTDQNGCPCVDFICKNNTALSMVRPSHFVEDMQQMANSAQYLDFEVQQLAAEIEKHCREQGW